ncbi:MAG: OmpA family protein [Bacteroidia bacterium]|nr:OmpA family protein [Bacteroidia bacterium]
MIKKNSILFSSLLFLLSAHLYCQKTSSYVILFETNSFNISAENKSALKFFLAGFDTVSISTVSVLGYCDERGTNESNLILSAKRANKVKDLLIQLKLNAQLIKESEGKGELETAKDEKIRPDFLLAQNRKVEIKITFNLIEKEKIIVSDKPKESEVVKTEPEKTLPSDTKGRLTENQKVGDKITLDNILFEGGEHFFLKESYPALQELGATMLKVKKYHILILGHVCCVQPGFDGTDFSTGERNLSVTRAKAVYDYLVQIGVDAKRLDYKGMKGDFRTGKGDKYDRRVEIEIMDIKEE